MGNYPKFMLSLMFSNDIKKCKIKAYHVFNFNAPLALTCIITECKATV